MASARMRALGSVALVVVAGALAFAGARPHLAPRDSVWEVSESAGSGPNLVLITLDTVRADRLAPYGASRVTTPRLDAFVERHATVYEQSRSTTSWTLPSHASMLTGLMPAQHCAAHHRDRTAAAATANPARPLRDDVTTLAEHLLARGYETAGIVSNSAYLQRLYGLHRGFAYYDDRAGAKIMRRPTLLQVLGWRPRLGFLAYRDATAMTDLALDWLEERDRSRPYFLFVNYMDAHFPYLPAPPFDDAFEDRRPADPLAPQPGDLPLLYDRELAYLDQELARLLDRLEGDDEWGETMVMIVSDHGEAFGEHGFWMHGRTLYEEMVRVPFYVKPPGTRTEARTRQPVNSSHVYHMALQALGVPHDTPSPATNLIGEWFQSDKHRNEPQPAPIDRDLFAWLDGSVKTIVSSKGTIERFDLSTDPGEQAPLALSAEATDPALSFARSWWQANPPVTDDGPAVNDEEALERLRALGYID